LTPFDDQTFVILTPGFPGSEADTTCLPMQQSLVRTIQALYPKLKIVVLSFQYPYHCKPNHWFGLQVIPFNGKNKGGPARLLMRRKINAALRYEIKENEVMGLLSFWYGECALVGKRMADKQRIKHFCWLLGQDARAGNKYPGRIAAGADELIALSEFIRDEFEKNYGVRPAHLITPGVQAEQYSSKVAGKDIDIVAAGSLIPLKQYEVLIDVVAELKKERPEIKAVLIGDGVEKELLKERIAQFGLENNITVTGELPHAGVLQWMRRGNLFLHPSSYEGFGVVCLEALLSGCQVIGFCQPMKQVIEQWHIVKDKNEMKEKAFELLKDPHTAYELQVPFTLQGTAMKMMELFDPGSQQ